MNEESRCPIWDTPASEESTDGRQGKLVDSPRAGGRYFISGTAIGCLPRIDERGKARLTSWLVDQRRLGVKCPEIDSNTITMAEQKKDLPVHERADRLLRYIEDQTEDIGCGLSFLAYDISKPAIVAWSESVEGREVEALVHRGVSLSAYRLPSLMHTDDLKPSGLLALCLRVAAKTMPQ